MRGISFRRPGLFRLPRSCWKRHRIRHRQLRLRRLLGRLKMQSLPQTVSFFPLKGARILRELHGTLLRGLFNEFGATRENSLLLILGQGDCRLQLRSRWSGMRYSSLELKACPARS